MDDQTIKNVLNGLNETDPVYLKIIYFKCLARVPKLTNEAIGKELVIDKNTVYQKDKQIEIAFSTHGVRYPNDKVCAALAKHFTPYPDFKPIEEPKEAVPAPIANTSPSPTPTSPPASVIPPRTPPSTSRPTGGSIPVIPKNGRSKLPFILAGVGIAAIILAGWIFRVPEWLWPERQAEVADIMPNEVTRIVEVIVEVTRLIEVERVVTVMPIEVTRLVEVIATVPIERQVEVTRLATVEVPVQVEVTRIATVEVPVTVEVTPVPPTPTPLPQAVTISEDFDDGEMDSFFVTSTSPDIRNGQLWAPILIEIGDESWRNYSITYEFSPLHGCGTTASHINVRANDEGSFAYYYNICGSRWEIDYEDSGIVRLEDGPGRGSQNPINIRVQDDQIIQTYEGGQIRLENFDFDSGGIILSVESEWIDNLVITRND